MTAETCADKECRRPPVQGSKYCEYHLAERTRKFRNVVKVVGPIGAALVPVVGVAIKIVNGRRS